MASRSRSNISRMNWNVLNSQKKWPKLFWVHLHNYVEWFFSWFKCTKERLLDSIPWIRTWPKFRLNFAIARTHKHIHTRDFRTVIEESTTKTVSLCFTNSITKKIFTFIRTFNVFVSSWNSNNHFICVVKYDNKLSSVRSDSYRTHFLTHLSLRHMFRQNCLEEWNPDLSSLENKVRLRQRDRSSITAAVAAGRFLS